MIFRFISIGMMLCILSACPTENENEGKGKEEPDLPGLELNVMSFNIRYDTLSDGVNIWRNRKAKAAQVFLNEQIDIAGTQEVLLNQLNDLKSYLTGYSTVGVGRNGGNSGEFNPIFYRTDRFTLVNSGTFWLSDTPDVPGSKTWGNDIPRIATWGLFEEISSGERFFFINTHLDHQAAAAQQNGSRLIMQKIGELHQGLPVIFTGDLNITPENSIVRLIILSLANAVPVVHTKDAAKVTEGADGTFHSFTTSPKTFIDYIFVSKEFKVALHRVVPAKLDEVFLSDHSPVVSKIKVAY